MEPEDKREREFFFFLYTETNVTHRSLHKIHIDDTPSEDEWTVKITLFHKGVIQLKKPCLQLLIKYPDTGKSLFIPKTIANCCCMSPYCVKAGGTFSTYISITYNCGTKAVRKKKLCVSQKLLTNQSLEPFSVLL